MPNGNKNNGNDDIELLPLELQRPEEKRKKEERPEVKLFVPETEEKPQKSTFMGKFFSSKQTLKPISPPPKQTGQAEESDLSVFKMQKEVPKAAPVSPPPPTRFSPPLPLKPILPPPRPIIEQRPPQKIEMKRPQNSAPKTNLSKPSGEKISTDKKTDITLIPVEEVAVKEKRGKSRQIILLVVVAVILAFIGVGAYLALKWYENKTELVLQKVEADLEVMDKKNRELALEKDQAQFFQKKLKTADKLLGSHIYWTNFFSFLEKNTVADVYFVNLIGGSDGQVVLSGVAKSYRAMARQIVSFRADDRVSKVSIMSASASVDTEGNVVEVNFDAKLQLSSEIFLK
ncbi:MAG: hypothetical protein WC348_02555 [Patescibacteria group bacterium]|jgi:cell division protein FtsB